jgi:hypothetical protein
MHLQSEVLNEPDIKKKGYAQADAALFANI